MCNHAQTLAQIKFFDLMPGKKEGGLAQGTLASMPIFTKGLD